ncbi:hypothetical protein DCAR_0206218 [Daucus carota subsp. sativus]|uniref:Uncharacterized protein n=1 Tax=Daucus carota subsp. sativus TaxID=79200 RepID=A0A162AR79_DAUCS|nr:hypothetical protein DCAR_0206218 [Daucus carota subsp. sativus]
MSKLVVALITATLVAVVSAQGGDLQSCLFNCRLRVISCATGCRIGAGPFPFNIRLCLGQCSFQNFQCLQSCMNPRPPPQRPHHPHFHRPPKGPRRPHFHRPPKSPLEPHPIVPPPQTLKPQSLPSASAYFLPLPPPPSQLHHFEKGN